jgi:hypothetical protein
MIYFNTIMVQLHPYLLILFCVIFPLMQIVDCNALPTLILMLRSEDAAIHYEAVRH